MLIQGCQDNQLPFSTPSCFRFRKFFCIAQPDMTDWLTGMAFSSFGVGGAMCKQICPKKKQAAHQIWVLTTKASHRARCCLLTAGDVIPKVSEALQLPVLVLVLWNRRDDTRTDPVPHKQRRRISSGLWVFFNSSSMCRLPHVFCLSSHLFYIISPYSKFSPQRGD